MSNQFEEHLTKLLAEEDSTIKKICMEAIQLAERTRGRSDALTSSILRFVRDIVQTEDQNENSQD